MKIIQIGDNVSSGHRFNGHDLGKYLRARGHECKHIVWNRNYIDEDTFDFISESKNRNLIHNICSQLNQHYATHSLFYPFSYNLLFDELYLNCDLVHMHLIHNGFFSIDHLPILSRLKPVVWTIHDPWPTTGHCIYPMDCNKMKTGCGDCPDLLRHFPVEYDCTALNWEYKRIVFDASDFDIIVASKWMYDRVTKSPMFKGKNVHVVNFGLNLEQFKPGNIHLSKQNHNIPVDNFVIAFRSTSSMYKGLEYIKECLKKLKDQPSITLLTFNEKGLLKEFSDYFEIIELGWVTDDGVMIDAYNAVDAFLMPSTAEAFGMMAMEAMACGKPVIVMDNTSLPEVIKPGESGCIVVPQGDVAEMYKQLKLLIDNRELINSIGKQSRLVAEKYYDKNRYVNEIEKVYTEIIDRKKGDNDAIAILNNQKKVIGLKNYKQFFKDSYATSKNIRRQEKTEELLEMTRIFSTNKYSGVFFLNLFYPVLKLLFRAIGVVKRFIRRKRYAK